MSTYAMDEPTGVDGTPPVTGGAGAGPVAYGHTGHPDGHTGHPAVDAALRAVRQVADAPPAEQIPTFQAAHRSLRETLASIDEG